MSKERKDSRFDNDEKKDYTPDSKKFDKGGERHPRGGKKGGKGFKKTPPPGQDSGRQTVKGVNDPAWYNHNPQLINDVGSIPFSQSVGLPMAVGDYNEEFRLPGILTLRYTKTPGIANGASSALNMAARDFYSYIRHANSGSRNYEAADLMIYLLAMGEAYAYYFFLRKIYGCAMLSRPGSRYLPRAIVQSMNVDYDDLIKQLATFRGFINSYAARLSALKVPSNFNIFRRWTWMDNFIFADSKNVDKAQLYHFVPFAFRKFSATEYSTGGALVTTALTEIGNTQTSIKVEELQAFGESMLESLLQNEDIGIISGDIIKAFGDNVFTIDMVDEAHTTAVLYDEEVLSAIQNAYCNGTFDATSDLDITQSNQLINFDPTATFSKHNGLLNVINMPFENPTPMDIVVATRMRSVPKAPPADTTTATYKGQYYTLGSELYHQADITYLNEYQLAVRTPINFLATSTPSAFEVMTKLSNFAWHPTVAIISSNTADTALVGYMCDAVNMTRFTREEQKRIDDTVILSLFNMPINSSGSSPNKK